MKWHRIYSMILRHYYIFKQSPDRISEVFFWPLVDVLIWGLTGLYFANLAHFPGIVTLLLSGLIFWTLVFRLQQEIPMALLEELWNKNLINVFTSPVSFFEWFVSILILGISKVSISMVFISILAFFLYTLNILSFGLYLIPFAFLLMMTAWSLGFFVTGLIMRYSSKVQTLAWSLTAILSPFTGVYYSTSVLPHWAQIVSKFIPTSYVFESMRNLVLKGHMDPVNLYISFGLNTIYLIFSIIYFRKSFRFVLKKGLIKVW